MRTVLRYVRFMACAVRLCLSSKMRYPPFPLHAHSVFPLLRPTQKKNAKIFGNILHHLIGQFVLDMHELEQ